MKKEILQCDCDFSTVHNFLSRSPERSGIPIEQMVKIADRLWEQVPLTTLVAHSDLDIRILIKNKR